MTCGKCDAHMTGADVLESYRRLYKVVEIWPYDHFCTATPRGRKIKSAADFSGREWPKWCPRRREEYHA